MTKRTGPVASSGGNFTTKKGDKKRGAPPGNTNGANAAPRTSGQEDHADAAAAPGRQAPPAPAARQDWRA
jgi:hypothetical protein